MPCISPPQLFRRAVALDGNERTSPVSLREVVGIGAHVSASIGMVSAAPQQPAKATTSHANGVAPPLLRRGGERHLLPDAAAPSQKLIDVLYGFALADPERHLFDWLDDKGEISNSYSRGELWNRGRMLAQRLEKDGIKRGDFVMIVYP